MEDVFVMILTIAMVVALVLTVLHAYKNLPLRQGTKLICCVAIVFFRLDRYISLLDILRVYP